MEELISFAQQTNIPLTAQQIEQFNVLLKELITWNAHTNLTAIREEDEIIKKHFIDSLTVVPHIPPEAESLIDIGSGAGFPGFPIKIAKPELHVTLIDSVEKKTAFHRHVIETLKLEDITSVHARVEDLARHPECREQFDVVTARAVANLSTLIEYTIPFLKVGGICIAQKSANDVEIEESQQALAELNAHIEKIIPIEVADLSPRQLLIIKKIKSTSDIYPRANGIPLKKPL